MIDLETKGAIGFIVRDVEQMIDDISAKNYFSSKSGWLCYAPINIYARAQVRMCKGEMLKVITIATIEVDPRRRSQGIFKELLENLKMLARIRGYDAVVVESINNHRLRDHLLGKGFQTITNGEETISPTLFKKVKRNDL